MRNLFVGTAAIAATVSGMPLLTMAHHSGAGYDRDRTVEISGTVTYFAYRNPHVHLDIETTNGAGSFETWRFELQSPGALRRRGWTQDSVEVGDYITMVGHPLSRGDAYFAEGLAVRLADGSALYNSSAAAGIPLPPIQNLAERIYEMAPPAESMEGTWLLGFLDARQGGPARLYGPPTEQQLEDYPDAPFQSLRFIPYLNERAREILLAFDKEGLNNPWCTEDPYLLAHYIEDMIVGIEMTDEGMMIRRQDGEQAVYINAEHPPASDLFAWGHAVGEWDGDALLIGITNFEPNPWGIARALPSGSQKHVTHRITWGEERRALLIDTVLYDPEFMTAPYESKSRLVHAPHLVLSSVECSVEAANLFYERLESGVDSAQ